MRASILKAILIIGCVFSIASALLHIKILGDNLDETQFLAALGAQVIPTHEFDGLRDVRAYYFSVPACPHKGLLFVGGFAARATLQNLIKEMHGNAQQFYNGVQLRSLDKQPLMIRYVRHQIEAKAGLSPDTIWSQKIVVSIIDRSCRTVEVQLDGRGYPAIAR